ncbi:ArnT family glycosyltransferase [Roseibium salinum]|uniref:Glycosyltransferase family 39 protein n=1 Tax=Roseibium salinum TaxID=1604349 RepID=A0ABT3R3W7_9HYPH|nr:glycosyltransferase family 39 protein [Roseibium sp. DSM 29163]MCX2723885.1 glycosyltransferase family 39 protein [Roseibium sp. DSM 29163]
MTLEKTDDLPFFLRPAGLVVVVGLLTALKLFASANAHFVEDEAYYRLWGLYPALSYYDHPPMIGWWIAAGQAAFGDTVFAVRVLVIVSGLIGTVALWRTSAILFDRKVAGWAVLFLNTSLLVGIGGILATPDAPSVFFWGLTLWALAELSVSKNPNWWLLVGLMAGCGLLSKYSVLFLGAGIVLWLAWVPAARRWWGAWQLWAGGAIAIMCFSPVLYWNHAHEWASFYKQFGRAANGGYTAKYIFEFLGALIGLANPLIAILAALGAVKLFWGLRAREIAPSLLLLTVLPFLLYLLYHSLHARVQANWPAPLFPAFALMAAVFVAGLGPDRTFWRRFAAGGVVLGLLVAVLVQLHAVRPFTGQFARKDPTFQLRGWPEIGGRIKEMAARENAAFVVTSSYGLNGQLDFLLKDTAPVIQINERIRYVMKPEPVPDLFDRPGLYVTEGRRDRADQLSSSFRTVEEIAELERQVKGIGLEKLVVYKVEGRIGPVLEPLSYR